MGSCLEEKRIKFKPDVWRMPIVFLALRRMRQEDGEFETRLS